MAQQLYKAKTLVASAARTVTGNSGFFDFPMEYVGGKFYIDVSAASGTSPTLDIAIETTYDDGTTAIVCWRSAQISSAADYEIQTHWRMGVTSDTDMHTGRVALAATGGVISLPTPIADKLRVEWTIGGTNPSFTFAVYFIPWRNKADMD